MAKGSGITRSSSASSPRGLRSGGSYVTYIDEDTGERTRIWVSEESAEAKKARQEFEKFEAKQEKKIDAEIKKRDNIAGKIYKYRDKVRELDRERRALMSDMEDELGRNETPQRRDWYGRRLDRIDREIDYNRNMYIAENVNWNTADNNVKRLEAELNERRRLYRESRGR